MSHGNGQKFRSHALPVIDGFIVEICPVEIKVRIELSFRPRVCIIDGLFRIHGYEYLHQRKQTCEDLFLRIFGNLVGGLRYRDTAPFQFNVEQRHAINEQHQIPAPVLSQEVFPGKFRLFGNLIPALTRCDFQTVIDLQTDFFAIMKGIFGILPFDGNRLTVNEAVQRQRGLQ